MKGRCKSCHEVGASHCSDPVACGSWVELTEEMRDILMHSLGSSHKGSELGWRNYYCALRDDPQCTALVEMGLMSKGAILNNGQDQYFSVTPEGKKLCGVKEVR